MPAGHTMREVFDTGKKAHFDLENKRWHGNGNN
jgi:hypothetical protein